MSSPLELGGSLLAGAALALWMFGGLWVTVRRLPSIAQPTPLILISFGLRLGGTVLGFALLALVSWQAVILALVGFLIARTLLVRLFGSSRQEADTPNRGRTPA
ncbi:MAG: hypothetical protein JSV66_18775 [Trueperaceae bacterium]|nr:MAG: hypothetical protein JSV66_18775 [Trueperaceae bacterium]